MAKVLYETDKHVQDNIQLLCMFLAMHGFMPEEIKNVYVLGHSMGLPDLEYFKFLADATRVHNSDEADVNKSYEDIDSIDDLHNRLQYAINHGGYQVDYENLDEEHMEAVYRKYSQEQNERNKEFEKCFLAYLIKLMRKI